MERTQEEADAFSCWAFGDVVFTRALCADVPARHCGQSEASSQWCVVLAHSPSGRRDTLFLADAGQTALGPRSPRMTCGSKSAATEVLTLYLPRDFCRDELSGLDHAHDPEIDPRLGALLAGYMDNLARQLPKIAPDHAHGLAAATRSLVSACIAPRAIRPATATPLTSLLIERARIVIRQNMAAPEFGPESLARLMAMSRSKLYRLFESMGGVAQFINRERLRDAHRRLVSPRDTLPIHVIGSEVGFPDHSTFSRSFRREFGCSPTEARQRSLAGHRPTS